MAQEIPDLMFFTLGTGQEFNYITYFENSLRFCLPVMSVAYLKNYVDMGLLNLYLSYTLIDRR